MAVPSCNPVLNFVISNLAGLLFRKKCKSRHRCSQYKPGAFLLSCSRRGSPGWEGTREMREKRKSKTGRSCAFRPPLNPSNLLPISSCDLVRAPWRERSSSQSLLTPALRATRSPQSAPAHFLPSPIRELLRLCSILRVPSSDRASGLVFGPQALTEPRGRA